MPVRIDLLEIIANDPCFRFKGYVTTEHSGGYRYQRFVYYDGGKRIRICLSEEEAIIIKKILYKRQKGVKQVLKVREVLQRQIKTHLKKYGMDFQYDRVIKNKHPDF